MKLNAAILMVMFLALSGFTWGSEDDKKTKDAYGTASSASTTTKATKKKSNPSMSNSSRATNAPVSSGEQRANAVRILTSGDEATRKARLESLTRLARSLAAAKQAKAAQNTAAKASYQY